mgnify:CR=1 FL=1
MNGLEYYIEKVDANAYDEVADILTEALLSDPLFVWFIRNDGKKQKACKKMFKTILEKYYSQSIIYKDKSSNSSSIWIDSNDLLQSSNMSIPMKFRFLFHAIGWCSISRLTRYLKMVKLQEVNHPPEYHHYLWLVGVRPAVQGQGLGTRILTHHLNVLDNKGIPAYLEFSNEINAPFYRRLGFSKINETKLGDGGPYLSGMWRDPL